jgi:hypothetical protein
MLPQEGTTIWARAFGVYPKNDLPWLLSWQVDEGITWSLADDLDCPWWSSIYAPSEQKYGLDILMNIILYSLDKPLPQDIVLVNAVRRDFRTYKERTSTINSFIDFIEKFGANPNQIITDMLVVDATIEVAMEHYMEGRYDEALEKAEEAHSALAEFERRTMKLKSQALFWVYVTEWAVVSGTGLLVGYLLFILMFRKILYKQVQVTRLGTEL